METADGDSQRHRGILDATHVLDVRESALWNGKPPLHMLPHKPSADAIPPLEHNLLEKRFWGLFPVERAAAMFHHDGERTRHIIYNIKYWGHPEVGTYLARMYAKELKESGFFEGIDAIIPIPLHWLRQLKRHYNQSHYIAQGFSMETGLPVWKDVVKRTTNNPSQTRKKGPERIANVAGIFRLLHPERIAGKHLLLVDDVVTTGATLTSCAQALAQAPDVRISILTLAIAAQTAIPALQDNTPETSVFGVPLLE